ncbi:hypothetical protein GCM10023175_36250 [Pseudonocardia xishanensis]|uniref:DUF732 domain-containing protein n=1 Tax=Pseudonocardia xishanensis TaxID=630995 RepID=A0ABP8RTV1_9PSEU
MGQGDGGGEGFRSTTRTYDQQVDISQKLTNDPRGFVVAATRIFCPHFAPRLPAGSI